MLEKYSAKYCPFGQPVPGLISKVNALETWLSGLRTVTEAVPACEMSVGGMLAVTRPAFTNVVVRDAPFHSTVAPETKPLHSTVSVKPALPTVVLAGASAVSIGGPPGCVTVKVMGLEILPSRFLTVMVTVPAVAMSAAVMLARTCMELYWRVDRGLPFQRSWTPFWKPSPSAMSVKAGPPAVAELGVSAVITGSGRVVIGNLTVLEKMPP